MEGNGFEGLSIRYKGQGEGFQGAGQKILAVQRIVGYGLCQCEITDPVDACQRVGHKEIPRKYPGIDPGDGAHILFRFRNLHHGVAPADSAGIAAVILGNAGAYNAADIASAGQSTFCKTTPDGSAGKTRDTAHIVAVFTGDGAKAPGFADQTQFHPSANAAHIAAFAGNPAGIFTVAHNGL